MVLEKRKLHFEAVFLPVRGWALQEYRACPEKVAAEITVDGDPPEWSLEIPACVHRSPFEHFPVADPKKEHATRVSPRINLVDRGCRNCPGELISGVRADNSDHASRSRPGLRPGEEVFQHHP
jgi:hypothetical protein